VNLPIAILVVLGAAAVAALALALVRRRAGAPLLADGGRGGPKIIVTGTLFAVVLAFVILAAFQTYNGAKTAAQSEAVAVLDMARAASLFPPAQRDQLHAAFTCYGRAVVAQEWPAMENGHSSPLVEHWIAEYRSLYRRLDLRPPRAQLAFKELLDQGATRTAGRLQRLDKATPSVSPERWEAAQRTMFDSLRSNRTQGRVACTDTSPELGSVHPRAGKRRSRWLPTPT